MILPGSLKKIIAVFRGEVAPSIILLSVALGFWFGLTPGWSGLHVALLAIVLIVNTHIGIFLLAGALGKAVCWAAAPVLFQLGLWVQEHLAGLLKILSDLPVIGVTDFSICAVAGAAIAGPVVGLILGAILAWAVHRFRTAMVKLDENSAAFQAWRNKGWVRLLSRILLGKGAKDPKAVLTRKVHWVRKAGVALAILLLVGSGIAIRYIEQDATTDYAAQALSRANGAEVNLTDVGLDVLAGRVSADDLQATDPEQPANNRINVGQLTADVSWFNLSRGRLVVDELALSDVTFNQPRNAPGEVGQSSAAPPATVSQKALDMVANVDAAQLVSYLDNAKQMRQWLDKLQEWLPLRPEDRPLPQPPTPESYPEYLAARAPVPPTPRLVIRRAALEPVDIPVEIIGPGRIVGTNFNDAPYAAGLPVTLEIASRDKPIRLAITCEYSGPDPGATLEASFENVDLAQLQKSLKAGNAVAFEAGTVSGSASGRLTRETIDLSLRVRAAGMKLRTAGGEMFGLDSQVAGEALKTLESIELTLRLVGPLTEPRLVFDGPAMREALKNALVDAGKNELARQVDQVIQQQMPGLNVDTKTLLDKPVETGQKVLDNLLKGQQKDDAAAPADASTKDKPKAPENKDASEGLKNLFKKK